MIKHCGTFHKCNNAEGCMGCEYEEEQELRQFKIRSKLKEYISLDDMFKKWQETVFNQILDFGAYCHLMRHHYIIY